MRFTFDSFTTVYMEYIRSHHTAVTLASDVDLAGAALLAKHCGRRVEVLTQPNGQFTVRSMF